MEGGIKGRIQESRVQDRRDAEQEICWTGQDGCRKGGMQDWRDAGLEGCMKGGMKKRRDEE